MSDQSYQVVENELKAKLAAAINKEIEAIRVKVRGHNSAYQLSEGVFIEKGTQREIAAVLGTKQAEISKVKNFKLNGFTIGKLVQWAISLGVQIDVSYGVRIKSSFA